MDALQVYGALLSKIKSVASGFKKAEVLSDGETIKMTFIDGSTLNVKPPSPKSEVVNVVETEEDFTVTIRT